MWVKLKSFWDSINLEPLIFLFSLGWGIYTGVQTQTNLLMWKICHIEMGHPEDICQNLTLSENDDVQSTVQQRVNTFNIVGQWIGLLPTLVFSLFAGSLSDDFGRKPLILWPTAGAVLSAIFSTVNYAFINVLPLEFFYFDYFWQFLGGSPIYYLGIYGYGATVSRPEERAKKLARFDALELLGTLAGTLLSPVVYNAWGYYGTYICYLSLTFAAFLQCLFFTTEPITVSVEKKGSRKPHKLVQMYLVKPTVDMFKALVQKRSGTLRCLLWLQLFLYGGLWLNLVGRGNEYLYLQKIFEGYSGTSYAMYRAGMQALSAFTLLLIMPIISRSTTGCVKIHETIFTTIALGIEAVAYYLLPLAHVEWQYYLIQSFTFLSYGVWATTRTIFTLCVDQHEIGKIYAAVGIIAALAPGAASPIFNLLYNKTLDTFPGAYIILTASVSLVQSILYFVLYKNKHQMTNVKDVIEIEAEVCK